LCYHPSAWTREDDIQNGLSPDMALRIEKAFGVSMDTLMRMQNSHDIAQARKREKKIKVRPFKGRLAAQRSSR
jgi:plasmid maintenance system antidote protein VapI